jgi:hypothetical protein
MGGQIISSPPHGGFALQPHHGKPPGGVMEIFILIIVFFVLFAQFQK